MTSTRRRQPHPPRREQATPARRRLVWPVVGAVAVVALIGAVIMSLGETGGEDAAEVGSPGGTREPHPRLADGAARGAAHPAVGTPAPTVTGTDFEGRAVEIAATGEPTAIVFLAHWCPHCQAEVPAVQAWLEAGELPAGTKLVAVATGTDAARANYPPSAWLEREGWTPPVLVDDAAGTAAEAYGLSAYPFWVLLDGDGNVAVRAAGGVTPEAVGEALVALAG